MYKCEECGHVGIEEARFCTECGSELSVQIADLRCDKCGGTLSADDIFCTHCGTKVKTSKAHIQAIPQQSKPIPKSTKSRKKRKAGHKSITNQKQSGVSGWMKWVGILIVAFGAYYFWFNDSDETYGNKDYSVYSDNTKFEESPIPNSTSPALDKAHKEYLDAFEKYTKLVTTGGEGDVQEALEDYKNKYQKYIEVSGGGSTFPEGAVKNGDDLSYTDLPPKTSKSFSEDLLISETVNNDEKTINTDGINVHIESGTFPDGERELKIYKTEHDDYVGQLFELELSNSPALFEKPIDIEILLEQGDDPKDFVALDEVSEGVYMVIPSVYDADAHSVKFKAYHFSKKGVLNYIKSKIYGSGSNFARFMVNWAVGSVGTAGGIVLVVGSGPVSVATFSVVVIGGLVLAGTGATNPVGDPLADEALKHLTTDLNTTFKLTDGLTVTWVDKPSSPSHLDGDKILVFVEKSTNRVLFAMDDKLDSKKRGAAMAHSIIPFAQYKQVRIPKVVLNLIVEMKIIKNYYKEKGYKIPPNTDMWIYKMSDAGGWNGTKLEIHIDYFRDESEALKASRMITLGHEYWHSVYQFNNYNPKYKWLDECLATSFEGQISPLSEQWYNQSIIPYDEQFYNRYSVDSVAESMRTGLIFSGEEGRDADVTERGYHFWPWGKYLLANQGHEEIKGMLSGKMSTKQLAAYFRNYCRSLLISDFSIGDMIEEDIQFDNKALSYSTPTGWNKLSADKFVSKLLLTPGNAQHHISSGVFMKPIPLSLNVLKFDSRGAKTNAPLIIRRSVPDEREEYIIIPSKVKPDGYGKYAFDDLMIETGSIVLPTEFTKDKSITFQLAIINKATEENWSEYFGYGENPMYAYFLRQPKEVVLNEVSSKFQLQWQAPDFDTGISEAGILGGYNIYLSDDKSVVEFQSVGRDMKSLDIKHYQLSGYTKIGVAAVDKLMKDEKGKSLISPIHWIPIKKIGGSWVKVKESYGYTMGDKEGTESTAEHSDWSCSYKYKIGSGHAQTSNSNNGRNTVDVETASFSHSWSKIPDVLQPGKTINQSISVTNNGSSGKNALSLDGRTSINVYPGEFKESVKAGGGFFKGFSWDNESQKNFTWTVPEPNNLMLMDPKRYRMKVSIGVSSASSGKTNGYYTIEYEYRP